MAVTVQFEYRTGLKRDVFRNARLTGSWGGRSQDSDAWPVIPMEPATAEDGCPCFRATVTFDESQVGHGFRWGVLVDGPGGRDQWAIAAEPGDTVAPRPVRTFVLGSEPSCERYFLTQGRRLGAQKYFPPGAGRPLARFAVWAPHARQVEVVFGTRDGGYIADDGTGLSPILPVLPMRRDAGGVWETEPEAAGALELEQLRFQPYMFRVTRSDGQVVYRTDLYSRCQMGRGTLNPRGRPHPGSRLEVNATVSCSVVVDPDQVTKHFSEPRWPEQEFVSEEEFWRDEYRPGRPVPRRVEDLVIYELHVGALGFGKEGAGTLEDAVALLGHLEALGVNAVELLPMSEFGGLPNWGYATTHYHAIEYKGGGRDQLKHFVRECHRRGIAVIMDVVYNHYHPDAERAEWMYDSNAHPENLYYWYEGRPEDYPDYERAAAQPGSTAAPGHGGYIDNQSTGYAPRFHEEQVRALFISSAVALMEEFHVDGFRVDQTTCMHSYNVFHANGQPASRANIAGARFLREWCRTLRLIRPGVMLMAEDHSGWDAVTTSVEEGGLGFDAAWYADFYHHLIGGPTRSMEFAKLLWTSGRAEGSPLAMGTFSGVLARTGQKKVVYHESHDEAGNGEGTRRTLVIAANMEAPSGERLRAAEARCRTIFGLSALSAGTPMFFMGEEVGAANDFRYDTFVSNREDLLGLRAGRGHHLFRYYQELIRLRGASEALRSRELEILATHDVNRVLAFRRWSGVEEYVVFVSLNDAPFSKGYELVHPRLASGIWKEIFNSDAERYGGSNVGNLGALLPSQGNGLRVVLPARGLIVLRRVDV
ncbi:alpha amylase C-terminal domain-containing protein [Pyxidicoccus parkwayensis]|uniref:1,4-alpha-glucan branching enzyme n=1 Tax=Pyxidicoccus parkwayensis TaxID=2813578 RepID=A0ABX7NWY3_9BACT|nr:alpha-amylase family glycosyl hydrolase [Pyxidicoccus parkwaysis]QSQ22884.1 alpha amylase C-terminal domain-containing protein [Pyxidicoccus parkwaysis]